MFVLERTSARGTTCIFYVSSLGCMLNSLLLLPLFNVFLVSQRDSKPNCSVCMQDTPPRGALPNGAPWVILSVSLMFMSLSSAAVAPFSKWISYAYVVLPMLGLGVGAAALVMAMGKKVTSRPLLRPDLVEPWLPENGRPSTSAANGINEPLLGARKPLKMNMAA